MQDQYQALAEASELVAKSSGKPDVSYYRRDGEGRVVGYNDRHFPTFWMNESDFAQLVLSTRRAAG